MGVRRVWAAFSSLLLLEQTPKDLHPESSEVALEGILSGRYPR